MKKRKREREVQTCESQTETETNILERKIEKTDRDKEKGTERGETNEQKRRQRNIER